MKGTKLTSAAPELGTSTHLTTELFKQQARPYWRRAGSGQRSPSWPLKVEPPRFDPRTEPPVTRKLWH